MRNMKLVLSICLLLGATHCDAWAKAGKRKGKGKKAQKPGDHRILELKPVK